MLGRTLGLVQHTYGEAEIAWRALGPTRTRSSDPRSTRRPGDLGWATSAVPIHPPPALDKRHLRRYARAWPQFPVEWPVGSIGCHGEPARGIASSEDSYDQTVTGCEVARGCPVAGRHQCLQTIGVTATAAGLQRERVRENPRRGAAVHPRPHFKATWVQNERLWLPPAPSLWQADTSGTHEAQQQAFSLYVQKSGASHNAWEALPTQRGGGLPRWVRVRLVPTGHGGAGGGPRGAAPPPPKCVCGGRSAPSPLLDDEQRLAAAGDGACRGVAHGEAMWRETRRRAARARVWSAAGGAQRCRRGRNNPNRAPAQCRIKNG